MIPPSKLRFYGAVFLVNAMVSFAVTYMKTNQSFKEKDKQPFMYMVIIAGGISLVMALAFFYGGAWSNTREFIGAASIVAYILTIVYGVLVGLDLNQEKPQVMNKSLILPILTNFFLIVSLSAAYDQLAG